MLSSLAQMTNKMRDALSKAIKPTEEMAVSLKETFG